MAFPRKYSEIQFKEAVESSTSVRQVLSKLKLKEAGGNYSHVKRRMEKLNLSLAKGANGQGWSKGKN